MKILFIQQNTNFRFLYLEKGPSEYLDIPSRTPDVQKQTVELSVDEEQQRAMAQIDETERELPVTSPEIQADIQQLREDVTELAEKGKRSEELRKLIKTQMAWMESGKDPFRPDFELMKNNVMSIMPNEWADKLRSLPNESKQEIQEAVAEVFPGTMLRWAKEGETDFGRKLDTTERAMNAGEEALNYAVLPAKAVAALAKIWKVVEAAGAGVKAVPMVAGVVKDVGKLDESYVAFSKERRRKLGLDSGKMNVSGANRENLKTHDGMTRQGDRSRIEGQFKSSKINLLPEGPDVVNKYVKLHSNEINTTNDVNDLLNQVKIRVPQKLISYVAHHSQRGTLDKAVVDNIVEYDISFRKTVRQFSNKRSVKQNEELRDRMEDISDRYDEFRAMLRKYLGSRLDK